MSLFTRRQALIGLAVSLLPSCDVKVEEKEKVAPKPEHDAIASLVAGLADTSQKVKIIPSDRAKAFPPEKTEQILAIFPTSENPRDTRRIASEITFNNFALSEKKDWVRLLQDIGIDLGMIPNEGRDGTIGRSTERVFKLASRLGDVMSCPFVGHDEKNHSHIYHFLSVGGVHGLINSQLKDGVFKIDGVEVFAPKDSKLVEALFTIKDGSPVGVADNKTAKMFTDILTAARCGREKDMSSYSFEEVQLFRAVLKEAMSQLLLDINELAKIGELRKDSAAYLKQLSDYQEELLKAKNPKLSDLIEHFQTLSLVRYDRMFVNFNEDEVGISTGPKSTGFKVNGKINAETVARLEMSCPWIATFNPGKGLHSDLALLISAPVRARSVVGDIELGSSDPVVAILRSEMEGYSGQDDTFSRDLFAQMQRYYGIDHDETVLGARFFTRLFRESAERNNIWHNL